MFCTQCFSCSVWVGLCSTRCKPGKQRKCTFFASVNVLRPADRAACPTCHMSGDVFVQVTERAQIFGQKRRLYVLKLHSERCFRSAHMVEKTARAGLSFWFQCSQTETEVLGVCAFEIKLMIRKSRLWPWAWKEWHIVTKQDAAIVVSTHEQPDRYELIRWAVRVHKQG